MHKKSTSSLFLMELIIVILFFSLASTVCIQLFVKAHLLTEKTVNTNQSVMWTRSLSEGFLSCDGSLTELEKLFPENSSLQEDTLILYFDKNWEEVKSQNADFAVYQITLKLASVGGLATAHICSSLKGSSSEPIYELSVSKYIGQEVIS